MLDPWVRGGNPLDVAHGKLKGNFSMYIQCFEAIFLKQKIYAHPFSNEWCVNILIYMKAPINTLIVSVSFGIEAAPQI